MEKRLFAITLLLIVLVAFVRVLPHPLNVTPIGALALFSGAYLPHRFAWALPLLALFIGDAITGLYSLTVLLFVYVGFVGSCQVGRWTLSEKRSPSRFILGVLGGALVFFLISNLGNWLAFYPHSVDALINCYAQGIPFFGRTLIGDTLYAAMMFGVIGSG